MSSLIANVCSVSSTRTLSGLHLTYTPDKDGRAERGPAHAEAEISAGDSYVELQRFATKSLLL